MQFLFLPLNWSLLASLNLTSLAENSNCAAGLKMTFNVNALFVIKTFISFV